MDIYEFMYHKDIAEKKRISNRLDRITDAFISYVRQDYEAGIPNTEIIDRLREGGLDFEEIDSNFGWLYHSEELNEVC